MWASSCSSSHAGLLLSKAPRQRPKNLVVASTAPYISSYRQVKIKSKLNQGSQCYSACRPALDHVLHAVLGPKNACDPLRAGSLQGLKPQYKCLIF